MKDERNIELRVTYRQKDKKTPNKPVTIYCRVRCGRTVDIEFSTKLKLQSKVWLEQWQNKNNHTPSIFESSYSGEVVSAYISVVGDLKRLKEYIVGLPNRAKEEQLAFENAYVKAMIDLYLNSDKKPKNERKYYFSDYLDWLIKELSKEDNPRTVFTKGAYRVLAKGTVSKYKATLAILRKFEEVNSKHKPSEIDKTFRDSFVGYMRGTGANSEHINTRFNVLRSTLNHAKRDGYELSKDFEDSKMLAPLAKDVIDGVDLADLRKQYLSFNELEVLFNYDFKDNSKLSNARDLLYIMSFTAMRVGDLMRLDFSLLKQKKFTYKQRKTGTIVTVPIVPQLKKLIDLRLPDKISHQKLNDYIKLVCKEVGFTKLVLGYKIDAKANRKKVGEYPKYQLIMNHSGRRSFATNYLNIGMTPNEVRSITGHATEQELLTYLNVTTDEAADIFLNSLSKKAY